MKLISILLLNFIITTAVLARKLDCHMAQAMPGAGGGWVGPEQNFQLINIDTPFPKVINFDGSNMRDPNDPFIFSNECDNMMYITFFPPSDYEAIKEGDVSEIIGAVLYNDANETEHLSKITCKMTD